MRTPSELYAASTRAMPAALPEHEYPVGAEVRRVRCDGT